MATVPSPTGTGHTTAFEVADIAVTTSLATRHLVPVIGVKLDPESVTIFEELDPGPFGGEIEVTLGVE